MRMIKDDEVARCRLGYFDSLTKKQRHGECLLIALYYTRSLQSNVRHFLSHPGIKTCVQNPKNAGMIAFLGFIFPCRDQIKNSCLRSVHSSDEVAGNHRRLCAPPVDGSFAGGELPQVYQLRPTELHRTCAIHKICQLRPTISSSEFPFKRSCQNAKTAWKH